MNARLTADLARTAECNKADASSWLKVIGHFYLPSLRLYLSFSFNMSGSIVQYLHVFDLPYQLLSIYNFNIASINTQERESIIDAADSRIRALEDDREGALPFLLISYSIDVDVTINLPTFNSIVKL